METLPLGKEYKIDVQLKVSLSDYPDARPYFLPFKATYRLCKPTDFKGASIVDQKVSVGDDAFDIYVDFDQSPCSYDLVYSYRILNDLD